MGKILFDEGRSDTFIQIMIGEILDKVKTEQVRATVIWEPNHTELTVEPWEPLKMNCPYSNEKGGDCH